jgi:hypothetical protein
MALFGKKCPAQQEKITHAVSDAFSPRRCEGCLRLEGQEEVHFS